MDAIICVKCGRQVEELKGANSQQQPQIVITNDNSSRSTSGSYSAANMHGNPYMYGKMPKNKMTALLLCFFLGYFGVHKFYEGKPVMGLIYLFTGGLFLVGVFIDFLALLAKPPVYYV
jgi:restriction system protein